MIEMEKASPRNRYLLFKNRDGRWTWERINKSADRSVCQQSK